MKSLTHVLLVAPLFYPPGIFETSGDAVGWPLDRTFSVFVTAVVVLLLPVATVIAAMVARMLAAFRRERHAPGRVDGPSPEESANPERLSRHIVERAEQIRRALGEELSEVEIEMCILGYRACADDMITLGLLVEERLPKTNPLQRRKLGMARRSALDALMHTREAFPPGVLRTPHRECS